MVNGSGLSLGFEERLWTVADKLCSEYLQANPPFNVEIRGFSQLENDPCWRFSTPSLATLQELIDAENSDLFDVLKYVATADPPISREMRVAHSQPRIFKTLNPHEKEFIEYVLTHYISDGVDELSVEKLPELLKLKYFTLPNAVRLFGSVEVIRNLFIGFQKELYVGRGG